MREMVVTLAADTFSFHASPASSVNVCVPSAASCATWPWPKACGSMAKTASGYDQKRFALWPKEVRLWTNNGLGVIQLLFWRHFNIVLASNLPVNGVKTDGCPVRERKLSTGGIRLATGGSLLVQTGNRSLADADSDLPCTRKPSTLYGVSPCPCISRGAGESAIQGGRGGRARRRGGR